MNNYGQQLQQLQPPGMALPSDPDSAWVALLDGIAAEFSRIDGRTKQLETEITLQDGAEELLDEWESVLAVEDQCGEVSSDKGERLAGIRSRLSAVGGQTSAYFIGLIEKFGFDVAIQEETPFEMGVNGMGDPVGGSEWRHVWRIFFAKVPNADLRHAIECTIHRYKPAHTAVLFEYFGVMLLDGYGPDSVLLTESGDTLLVRYE